MRRGSRPVGDRGRPDGPRRRVDKLVLVHRARGLEGPESEQRALADVSSIFDGEVVFADELDVLEV